MQFDFTEAIPKGAHAMDDYWGGRYSPNAVEELSGEIAAILDAVAPLIAAQALRAIESELDSHFKRLDTWDAEVASQIITYRADELDQQ